jgi:hypothetical protein
MKTDTKHESGTEQGSRMRRHLLATVGILVAAWPAAAQTPATAAAQRDQRYQISTMERVLEGAVEHGAAVTRDRLRTIVPADMLLSESARVRGYRLDGYGAFFDVAVPMLEGSLTWSFRTLDQNNLGLDSALSALRSLVEKVGDANLEQAFKRIELQVAPVSVSAAPPGQADPAPVTGPRTIAGSAAGLNAPEPNTDRILDDPVEAFRSEIRTALVDAMLDHGTALRLAAHEMLTIAARSSDRPAFAPLGNEAQTTMISIRGSDLAAYFSGQISREEVRKRTTVRVF